jgi:4-aminobutyrate---pyruvate transaminase
VELVKDKKTKASFNPADGAGALLAGRTQANGLLVRAIGDTIAFCPPLIITEAEIDEMLERFGKSLDEAYALAKEKKLVA